MNKKRVVVLIGLTITLLSVFIYQFFQSPSSNYQVDYKPFNLAPSIELSASPISYENQVKPILEQRCIVCHGCYDAPCQLKLSSTEGLQRGASEERIYEPRRIETMSPTRLFIDAKSTAEWRSKGFTAVLNEQNEDADDNLKNSVLYRLLRLKKEYPQPDTKKLPENFSLGLDREQSCPKLDSIEKYSKKHPLWGMPYAMPNLPKQEYKTLVSWLAQGAKASPFSESSTTVQAQINQWEAFFNKTSKKERLVNRYLYEHLFHAHIHFAGSPEREFYRLVRSTTPSGEAINEIATLRPLDDPGKGKFYYRLLRYSPSIVRKNHIVYEFSDKRRKRFKELFLKPDYTVSKLPEYGAKSASNSFKVFAAIPAVSRYRFMLDDAYFFIEGFIKGPVCRGQLALNVIEDQFWVVFFSPDKPMITNDNRFLEKMADALQMPADFNNNFDLFRIWSDYWKGQRRYMEHKQAWFKKMGTHELDHAMEYIWDGDGKNPNAALTVFRHFDSGSVSYGLVGDAPETTWVIDFPLLERIHYLLVADFDVYGNIGHRMSTRIYMDFLRMEGEDSFLAFLPVNRRKEIRDKWYIGQREQVEKLFSAPEDWLSTESVKGYQTKDPQKELYQRIKDRTKAIHQDAKAMNHCGDVICQNFPDKNIVKRVDKAMVKIARLQGEKLHAFPDIAFVRIKADKAENDLVYSLIRNKAYKNVTSFLADARERDRADVMRDTMTVVKWLEGSYPNFFFSVDLSEIEAFSNQCSLINNAADYEKFVDRYGVRRTNTSFWEMADWFQERDRNKRPILSGIFDLSRYHNR